MPRSKGIKGVGSLFWPLGKRTKPCLATFRVKEEFLEVFEYPSGRDSLAAEVVDDLEAALEQFREIGADLSGEASERVT